MDRTHGTGCSEQRVNVIYSCGVGISESTVILKWILTSESLDADKGDDNMSLGVLESYMLSEERFKKVSKT